MARLLVIALLVAAAGITVVAVNGPGKDKPEKKTTGGLGAAVLSPQQVRDAGEVAAPVATILLRGRRLEPEAVMVTPGETVRFVNRDGVAHRLVADDPRAPGNPVLDAAIRPGQTATYTPRIAGPIGFRCVLHPARMIGLVDVSPPAA